MRNTALSIVSLVLLATLPFLGGVGGDFIEDDLGVIHDNPHLREGGELLAVWTDNYWGETWGGLYRPLTVFSYGVDRLVFGASEDGGPRPGAVHTTNLLINAGCAVLLFLILRRRFAVMAAWLAAGLFAAHPAHVEAVVHMVGRADLLAALFFLGAWYAHGSPGQGSARGWWLGGGLFFASLLSKESGGALPAVLFCEALLLGPRRPPGEFLRRQAVALAPYAVALLAFLLLRGLVLGAQMEPPRSWVLYSAGAYVAFPNPAPFEVALTMTHAFAEYLLLLVAPLRLSADYSGFPHHTNLSPLVLASAVVLGLLVAAAARAARRGRREPLVWLSFLTWTLLPVSNLVVVSGIVMAERVLYLPSVAAAGLTAAALSRLARRNAIVPVLSLVLLGLFVARSAVRAPVWSDPRTLFEETVESGRHHGHLALTGLCDVYLRELQTSSHADPDLPAALLLFARESVESHRTTINTGHLAWALEMSGDLTAALDEWARVEAVDPGRRADLIRCLTRLRVQVEDPAPLRAAAVLARDRLLRAREAGDVDREALWSTGLTGLLEAWVERAVERQTWLEAMAGCAALEQVQPASQVLLRHRVPVMEGAIEALRSQGRGPQARELATELERLDPGNPVAAAALAE